MAIIAIHDDRGCIIIIIIVGVIVVARLTAAIAALSRLADDDGDNH